MAEESDKMLTPQVQWSQRKHMIILRVLVKPVENPDFIIREDYMTFKGKAVGMSGKATFGFEVVFYEPVQSDKCRVKFLENEVEFRLMKKQEGTWPRLQSSNEKPHWISIDFTHWEYQNDGSDDEEEAEGSLVVGEQLKEMLAKSSPNKDGVEKEPKESQISEKVNRNQVPDQLKIAYLLVYNGVQWSGFILIVLALLKALRGGMDGISTAYEKTSSMIMFCHVLMLMEILHAALGIVKSGIVSTFVQVFGRFLIIFAVLRPAVGIHTHPIVFSLFLAWSLIEIIRYPFYALSVINFEVWYLTWLRYTAWIPLYPLGFACEALAIWFSLDHHDNNTDLAYLLPNPLNISFYPSYVFRGVLCLYPLFAYNQIGYMIGQRKRKLGKLKTH